MIPMLVSAIAGKAAGDCNAALLRDALLGRMRDAPHLLEFQTRLSNGIVHDVTPDLTADGNMGKPPEFANSKSWKKINQVRFI